jgi:hypothetical protein
MWKFQAPLLPTTSNLKQKMRAEFEAALEQGKKG